HFVGDLGLGLETLRRDPARGRNDQGRALDIETRELGEIDDHAVDRYRRTAADAVARRGAHAAAHHLPERAVFVITQERLVPFQHFRRRFFHLFEGHAAIDARVAKRAEQSLGVLAQLKRFVAESPGHVVNAVTRVEAAVQHGNFRLAFGHERATEINDSFFHLAFPFVVVCLIPQLLVVSYSSLASGVKLLSFYWAKKIRRNSLLRLFASSSVGLSMGTILGATFSAPGIGG